MKHLSTEKRYLLKQYLERGIQKQEIALLLGVSLSTVYRELKKGSCEGIYQPKFAQERYTRELKKKGKEMLLSKDKELAELISRFILDEKLSPKQIIERLKKMGYKEPRSIRTIYVAIDHNLIPNVTRQNLQSQNVTVFSKGLIQLPNWVRKELNIKDGDCLQIKIEKDSIIISQ